MSAAFKAPSLAYQSNARIELPGAVGRRNWPRALLEIDPDGACKRPDQVPPGLDEPIVYSFAVSRGAPSAPLHHRLLRPAVIGSVRRFRLGARPRRRPLGAW